MPTPKQDVSQDCTSEPGKEHVGLSRVGLTSSGSSSVTEPLAVEVTSTKSPILQMFLQVFRQTRYNFDSLPDHTRDLSLEIIATTGKVLTQEGLLINGKFTIKTFRKSGVMEFNSWECLEVPLEEYSVRMTASTMVLHNEKNEPEGRDELAYTAGRPKGYL